MNRRGFTLVEVLIAIFLIGIITSVFFPPLSKGISMMLQTRKFTENTFLSQQKIEHEILKLNNGSSKDWTDENISIFKESSAINVPLKIKKFDSINTSVVLLALSKNRSFLPELPEIDKVDLMQTNPNIFTGRVSYKNKKSKPSENWEQDVEFCLYRWYLADLKYITSDFNEEDTAQLALIKEYNPIREDGKGPLFEKSKHYIISSDDERTEIDVEGKKYSIIAGGLSSPRISILPNTKSPVTTDKTMDEFWKESLNLKKSDINNFDQEEMKTLYANKGIVLSVVPVAKKSGNLGVETYSKMVSLGFEDPSLSYGLTLGVLPIPDVVDAAHIIEAAVKLDSNLEKIMGQKFEVNVVRSSDNEKIFTSQYSTDKEGVFTFNFEVLTNDSYIIQVKGLSIKRLYAEGNISFLKPHLIFKDNKTSYPVGEIVKINATVLDEQKIPMRGETVIYEVYNIDKIMLRRSLVRSDKNGSVIMNTKCKEEGQYYVIAKFKTSSGEEIVGRYDFTIENKTL